MTNTASASRAQTTNVVHDAGRFLEWLMAIGEVEREFVAVDPRMRREIWFQAVALILCPLSFGYAIFNVATSLLGNSEPSALGLAVVAAFSMFAIDKHYLIQSRGDSSEDVRKAIYKVRFISIAIITLSFMLMATSTFDKDIERVLDGAKSLRRSQLEQSLQYKLELDGARDALVRAEQAAKRADELRIRIAQIQVERARAWEGQKNECEGNTTGNQVRREGCGKKARGYEAEANRLGLEIEAAEQELAQLGNVAERLADAKQRKEEISARIEVDAGRSVSGSQPKLDALWTLVRSSLSACVAVLFWFLIGMIPDTLMWFAQSRMFNHDLFARMRSVQNEVMQARITQMRGDLRQKQANKLAPIEVRLAAVAPHASSQTSDTVAHRPSDKLLACTPDFAR